MMEIVLDTLSLFNLEQYIDEVVASVCNKNFAESFERWTVHDAVRWIGGLSFVADFHEMNIVKSIFTSECVNGYCLTHLTESEWTETLQLDISLYHLIKIIVQGWKSKWGKEFAEYYSRSLGDSPTPVAVSVGAVTDLSSCDVQTARQVTSIDRFCCEYGVGGVYGQIIALGYKEYFETKHAVTTIGTANDSFVLKRRKVANGLCESGYYTFKAADADHVTSERCGTHRAHTLRLPVQRILHTPTTNMAESGALIVEYTSNPLMDLYQLGRASNGGNDWVLPGMIHGDDEGCAAGPVSRWACRIECERLPPFRCFIYAGGFDPSDKVLKPGLSFHNATSRMEVHHKEPGSYPSLDELHDSADGFSTYGVMILQPEVEGWVEVSVRGHVYTPRSAYNEPPGGSPLSTSILGNQLTDGTLISISGMIYLFQRPQSMIKEPKVNPRHIVHQLNALKPQCPVLFNEIVFAYKDTHEQLVDAVHQAAEMSALSSWPAIGPGPAAAAAAPSACISTSAAGAGAGVVGSRGSGVHVPVADYSDVNEENRPYVFPACGHVFAYHRSIARRPCPLCRRQGPFVPIAYAFAPAICSDVPTHVFNPCGHIASLAACQYWSKTPVYSKDISHMKDKVLMCPFCATELDTQARTGGPYNRLVIQTDTGNTWPPSPPSVLSIKPQPQPQPHADEEIPPLNISVTLPVTAAPVNFDDSDSSSSSSSAGSTHIISQQLVHSGSTGRADKAEEDLRAELVTRVVHACILSDFSRNPNCSADTHSTAAATILATTPPPTSASTAVPIGRYEAEDKDKEEEEEERIEDLEQVILAQHKLFRRERHAPGIFVGNIDSSHANFLADSQESPYQKQQVRLAFPKYAPQLQTH